MSFMPDSSFQVNEPTVISETIDGETIIIHLASGAYYSLKHSGAAIWGAIQQSASLGAIAAMVRSSYEVDGADIEHEISTLVERLVEEDLVRPALEDAAPPTTCAPPWSEGQRAAFVAPVLEKFTDMEAMLLLDPVHDVDEKGWPNLPAKERRMDA
jgi:Coenzyme PQQ synthesis protein D (PqqD)